MALVVSWPESLEDKMSACTNTWLDSPKITVPAASKLTAGELARLPGAPYVGEFFYIDYYLSDGQVVCRATIAYNDTRYYVLQASPACLAYITDTATPIGAELPYHGRIALFDLILPMTVGGGAGFLLGRNQTTGVKIGVSIVGAIAGFFAKRIILGQVEPGVQ